MTQRRKFAVFGGLLLVMLMATLDTQIVATALPTIVGDLDGVGQIAWVTTAYLLPLAVTTPLYGKLGDQFGRKPVLLFAIGCFLAGSVACGAAQSMGQLIAFRAMQGIGGGGLMASGFALLGDLFEPRERARYQGYSAAVFLVSSTGGPLVGGVVTEHIGWRWVFYLNLPLGIAAIAVIGALLVLPHPAYQAGRPSIDYPGALLLGGAVTCLVLLTGWAGTRYAWSSPTIVALGAGAVVLLVSWMLVERSAAEPIIPPRLFADRTFTLTIAVAVISGFTTLGLVQYQVLFLQNAAGATPTQAGLLVLAGTLGMVAASMGAGRVISRTGRYTWAPVASMALGAVATYLLSTMTAGTSWLVIGIYLLMAGLGGGFAQQVVTLIAQNAAPGRDLGVATSTVNFARMVGSSLGLAVFGAILGARLASAASITPQRLHALPVAARHEVAQAYADALSAVFLAAVPVLLAGLLAALLLPNLPLRGNDDAAGEPADDEATAPGGDETARAAST